MIFDVELDSFHEGHFDLISGVGLVVLPRSRDDVVLDGESLHAAAWEHVLEVLAMMGWAPRRTATGDVRVGGLTTTGRLALEVESGEPRPEAPTSSTWRHIRASAQIENVTV